MNRDNTYRCIVAEDEPVVGKHLAALAEKVGLDVVGVVPDGDSALALIESKRPDILLLDVEMPVMSGLEVLQALNRLPHPPAVILITAYDQYAVAAYALAAVDYVLKPVDAERFVVAVSRACQTVDQRNASAIVERLRGVLAGDRPERLVVRDRGVLHYVALSRVVRMQAMGDYVEVYADARSHLITTTLNALERVLARPPFVRVHRSHLINIDAVVRSLPLSGGRMALDLSDGARIPVSRGRTDVVRTILGGLKAGGREAYPRGDP